MIIPIILLNPSSELVRAVRSTTYIYYVVALVVLLIEVTSYIFPAIPDSFLDSRSRVSHSDDVGGDIG